MNKLFFNFKNIRNKLCMIMVIMFIVVLISKVGYAEIKTNDYIISMDRIDEETAPNDIKNIELTITNLKNKPINVFFDTNGNVSTFIELEKNKVQVEPNSEIKYTASIYAGNALRRKR